MNTIQPHKQLRSAVTPKAASKRKISAKANRANDAARHAELRRMLTGRRDELQEEVESGIRSGRSGRPREGGDNLEDSDAAVQNDIAISLLQMRAEMLARIEQAIVRLDAGRYGSGCPSCPSPCVVKRVNKRANICRGTWTARRSSAGASGFCPTRPLPRRPLCSQH